MSRKLRRVPLDFSWPLGRIWGGYVNSYYRQSTECPDCDNGYDRSGGRPDANAALFHDQWYGKEPFDPIAYGAEPISPDDQAIWDVAKRNVDRAPEFYMPRSELQARREFRQAAMDGFPGHDHVLIPFPTWHKGAAIAAEAKRLYAQCYQGHWCHHLIQADVDALVAADRLWDFTHRPLNAGQAFIVAFRKAFHNTNSWLPGPNGRHPTAAEVNTWSRGSGLGHDSLNQSICVEARCKREGVPYICARCEGSGRVWPTKKIKQAYEDWKETEPPTGDGYQLWEDVSEGSPVSPVFESLEDLCLWCEDNATTFGDCTASREDWKKMLENGFVHATMGNAVLM